MMPYVYDDGGRAAAGYEGSAGDCVVRSIAIATGLPYEDVYRRCAAGNAAAGGKRSAPDGIHTKAGWFKEYMAQLGFEWIPTMRIGQGTTVHLIGHELPGGRIICTVSKHYVAVIDGVIHDTHDPSRLGARAVYGYWQLVREPTNLAHIDTAGARLPTSYEQAKIALASCDKIDECQDWANKAVALASYAKMADDDSLRQMADKIQARAVRRMGELLKQFDSRGDHKESRGDMFKHRSFDVYHRSRQAHGAPSLPPLADESDRLAIATFRIFPKTASGGCGQENALLCSTFRCAVAAAAPKRIPTQASNPLMSSSSSTNKIALFIDAS
jgi:hypothetical protein